jgi:pimeloyl-ACP methyl ester carboxylesterase
MAAIDPGLRLHHVTAGTRPRVVVLPHGFPQTWRQWHRVIGPLRRRLPRRRPRLSGCRAVVAPTRRLRQAHDGGDIHRLLREHLRIEEPVTLVGHDIGLMVAYGVRPGASRRRVASGAGRRAAPCTAVFAQLRSDPRVWHFAFHGARDRQRCWSPGASAVPAVLLQRADLLTRRQSPTPTSTPTPPAYAAPGAIRAGFELYRAFDRDVENNRAALAQNGTLTVPVLARRSQAAKHAVGPG